MHSKPGEFFKTFKPLLANGNESSGNNCILWNVTGSVAEEQNIVAEEFAGYCSTLANDNGGKSSLSSKEDDFRAHPSVTHIENNWPFPDTFTVTEISHDETAKALDGLNTSESIGPDLILPTVLKLAVKELAPSPTKIFYLSLTSGYYISQEMGEDWAPVFKKDDKMEKKNYRPVTVLNAVKKIFEKLLSKHVATKVDLYPS